MMETTFITIHDLSPAANILYASDSIVDVLGYEPEEVVNTSTWDYFHSDELPIARARHGRGLELDKASVLSYCRMKDKSGQWVGCEIVFTIVYDCLVSCTSIYKDSQKSQSRANEAPAIRRLFSSSPSDPRYHMLSHLSSKFTSSSKPGYHEPRAALFLNRYTRTLTIMYATNGLAEVLGINSEEFRGRSFYYCIQENCLQDAVRCLENAKINNSIAYLRFWFRDPRKDDHSQQPGRMQQHKEDVEMRDAPGSDEDTDVSGVQGISGMEGQWREPSDASVVSQRVSSTGSVEPVPASHQQSLSPPQPDSRTSSGTESNPHTHEAIFGEATPRESSISSSNSPFVQGPSGPIELEAVVSCSSDGLVVCLRRAHPLLPQAMQPSTKDYRDRGLFASPWATEPIVPPIHQRAQFAQQSGFKQDQAFQDQTHEQNTPTRGDFMDSIRDIAVFAWALTGINGSLAEYGRGKPYQGSQPLSGLPIWKPEAAQHARSEASMGSGSGSSRGHSGDPFGDPGLPSIGQQGSGQSIPHFATTTVGPGPVQRPPDGHS